VESVLSKLKCVSNVAKIAVISNFNSISSMKYLKQKYDLQNVIFLKSNEGELLDTPSVFLTDESLKITKFLIINQNDQILDRYLKILPQPWP
jgi:hypothetical protein